MSWAAIPLAAMPSLHFATSVMAAHVLCDAGPVQGALGWAYAGTLGFALVYLGEHYVIDLLAGVALAEGVRRQRHRAAPALRAVACNAPAARGAGARMTSAPVDERDVEQPRDADDEEMPRVVITRERALGFGVFVAVVDRVPVLRPAEDLRPDGPRLRSTTWATASRGGCSWRSSSSASPSAAT